jgi:DnaJ-class molecular chaperone
MTFSQIEEIRAGQEPSLSLQQAASIVGLGFEQCSACQGRGWTKATLLTSPAAIFALAEACPDEPVAIQYDRCDQCRGEGGWIVEK